MKVTLLGKVFRRKCMHFPAFSLKMHAFSSNLHKMHTFSLKMCAFSLWKCVHFHWICIKCTHFHWKCVHFQLICIKCTHFQENVHFMQIRWKCVHFPNLNILRFRRLINLGPSYIYERPITAQEPFVVLIFVYFRKMRYLIFMVLCSTCVLAFPRKY